MGPSDNEGKPWPGGIAEHHDLISAGGINSNQIPATGSWSGPFMGKRQRPLAEITDGTSNTVMMSETIVGKEDYDARGFSWWGPTTALSTFYRPNTSVPDYILSNYCGTQTIPTKPPCANAGTANISARSLHPGGVNAVYCDGSVRFVSDNIDEVNVWRPTGTANMGEVVSEL